MISEDRKAVLDARIAEVEAALHRAELAGPRLRVMSLRTYLIRLRNERDEDPMTGARALLRLAGWRIGDGDGEPARTASAPEGENA